MDIPHKLVTELPLKEMWSVDGPIQATREKYITKDELNDLLIISPVEFVIANIGEDLKWVPVRKCYEIWNAILKDNVAQDIDSLDLDSFPNGFAYVASKWSGETSVILLERHH